MIKRLKTLEIEDFRIFRGRVSVPLDADVVLVYGPNGSGKTGLVSALEYAVIGDVEDLRVFSDDYPRCLKHIRADGDPRSCLLFESVTGDLLYQSTPPDSSADPGAKAASMSEADQRFFIERCYLSQRRLGRLFEIYQASDKQQPEQPLVRFVRELLSLDLLENLTVGLHEVGHIQRLQKGSRSLASLKGEEASLPEQKRRVTERKEERSAVWSESLAAIQAKLLDVGDPFSNAPWTATGLRNRREALESAEQNKKLSARLQELQQSQGRLESAVGLLRASGGAAVDDLEGLRARLTSIGSDKNSIEPRLTLLLQKAEGVLHSANASVSQNTRQPDVSRRLDEIEDALGNCIARLHTDIRIREETEQEMHSLENRAATLQTALAKLELPSARTSQEQRRWAELLQGVLDHLTGEVCPVCGRDYSELNLGNLKSRIAHELKRLGIDIERFETAAKQRSQIEADRDAVLRKIVAIKERTKEQLPWEIILARRDQLIELMKDFAAEKDSRQEWLRLQQEEAGVLTELRTLEERLSQQNKSRQQIFQLADELKIPQETRPPDPQSLAASISDYLRAQIDEFERLRAAREELLTALVKAERTAGELEDLDREAHTLNDKQQRIQSALGRVEQSIQKARGLARAANSAKERLITEVFNDTLNSLWEDLFERLVKFERFVPRISEPTVKRGQIRAAIRAITKGAEPFEQAGSVLSAANLNTAALSLFLSLHLVEPPRHRVILLDDPIQSMDDVHVAQLANLLRAIVREAGRQHYSIGTARLGRGCCHLRKVASKLSRPPFGVTVACERDAD
jgi:exonuclease SbcC